MKIRIGSKYLVISWENVRECELNNYRKEIDKFIDENGLTGSLTIKRVKAAHALYPGGLYKSRQLVEEIYGKFV